LEEIWREKRSHSLSLSFFKIYQNLDFVAASFLNCSPCFLTSFSSDGGNKRRGDKMKMMGRPFFSEGLISVAH